MKILNFFLNLIPYKYIKNNFNNRQEKEFFKERELHFYLKEKCAKEMIRYINSKGSGFKKELIVSPLVNLVPFGYSEIEPESISLDELREKSKKLSQNN